MNITEFLLARIAEDEAEAQVAKAEFAHGGYGCYGPARVLAECAAKRATVFSYRSCLGADDRIDGAAEVEVKLTIGGMVKGIELAIKHIAAVYKDHPDYQQEWAVGG